MERKDYIHGRFTIATTDILQFSHDEFALWWEEFHKGEETPAEDSEEYLRWCGTEAQFNWEADIENIRATTQYRVPCVIEGSVGRWDGRRGIAPERKDSVIEAIERITRAGYDDVDITFDDGKIEVSGHHHDGTDSFTIRALSEKGLKKVQNLEDRYERITGLKDWDYRRLPYLYAI